MITQEYLKSRLTYNSATGEFRWLRRTDTRKDVKSWNGRYAGKLISNLDKRGYNSIIIDRVRYKAHRLAWLYETGSMPSEWIDHRDGNPTNNSFANLREATRVQNARNRKRSRSGLKGAYRHGSKWRSAMTHEGRTIYMGTFETEADAHAAYCAKALELQGDFARFE